MTRVRQPAQLARLLERLAGQSAQVLNVAAAARAIGLDDRTAESYTALLESVFLLHRLPAWGTTLRSRAAASPKLYLIDSGVAARLLRLNSRRLVRAEAAARTEFGHLLETFVVGELLKQASWLDGISGCGHQPRWRPVSCGNASTRRGVSGGRGATALACRLLCSCAGPGGPR